MGGDLDPAAGGRHDLRGAVRHPAGTGRIAAPHLLLEYAASSREDGSDVPDPGVAGSSLPGPQGPSLGARRPALPGPGSPAAGQAGRGEARLVPALREWGRRRGSRAAAGPAPRARASAGGRRGAVVAGLAILLAWGVGPVARAQESGGGGLSAAELDEIRAAAERELEGLELLAARTDLGTGDWALAVEGYLVDAEVRLWQLEIAADAARDRLIGEVADGVGLPALLAAGMEARGVTAIGDLAAAAADWSALQAALVRAAALREGLRAAARTGLAGLPAPGRTCPVAGSHQFAPTWGEARPGGRGHKGEDVHAAAGTPLVALESGTIVQAGWHWQGGFGVYLEGFYSGDVYYYAHMAWFAPGIRTGAVVEVGDLVGWVGSSGNADSPHLHLGWIPDHPGPPVDLERLTDPYALLVGVCGRG